MGGLQHISWIVWDSVMHVHVLKSVHISLFSDKLYFVLPLKTEFTLDLLVSTYFPFSDKFYFVLQLKMKLTVDS